MLIFNGSRFDDVNDRVVDSHADDLRPRSTLEGDDEACADAFRMELDIHGNAVAKPVKLFFALLRHRDNIHGTNLVPGGAQPRGTAQATQRKTRTSRVPCC